MVSSKATTVSAYLAGLPPEQRATVEAVRATIARNMPKGYGEVMQYGMVSWVVPAARYPKTYNGQPLAYVSLAAQKRHYAVYLLGLYGDEALKDWFEAEYRKTGKRLDIGKSCVRFRSLADLPLPLIGWAVRAMKPDAFIALYEKARAAPRPAR